MTAAIVIDVVGNAIVLNGGACRSLAALKPFVTRGGESVTTDSAGNVYVANGQIFVYDPSGKEIGRIDVPERPLQILFGDTDRRTLYILTHHTLYGVKMQRAG